MVWHFSHDALLKNVSPFLARLPSQYSVIKRQHSRQVDVPFVLFQQAVQEVINEYETLCKESQFHVWAERFDHVELRWMRWLAQLCKFHSERRTTSLHHKMFGILCFQQTHYHSSQLQRYL